MTGREKRLIAESFAVIREDAGPVSLLFYGRLFALDPKLRPMFHGDIERQGLKLMEMLSAVVNSMDRFDELTPVLHAMGQRHTSYGVEASHYVMVERALVWAIGQDLGADLQAEVLGAWRQLIRDVSAVMQAGAAQLQLKPTAQ